MKRLIRPLVAGAGVTGALAALNRGLRGGPLPYNAVGGRQRRWTWRGHDLFATEAGEGSPILLIHSLFTGASSYEYRELFPLLAGRHRVVALDLLGCGLSARPNLTYSPELFSELILDALSAFDLASGTLVGSSLGAAFAIRAAARAGEHLGRLVAIEPTGLAGMLDRGPGGGARVIAAGVRSPLLGEAVFNALAARPSLRHFLEQRAYADPSRATEEVVDHYYAVTHQAGARYVPAHLAAGLLNCDVARDLPFVAAPILIAWGEHAPSFSPLANAGEFVKLAQHARLVTFADSALLPHEEEPQALADALESFLAT